jgi:hypothetical protein
LREGKEKSAVEENSKKGGPSMVKQLLRVKNAKCNSGAHHLKNST